MASDVREEENVRYRGLDIDDDNDSTCNLDAQRKREAGRRSEADDYDEVSSLKQTIAVQTSTIANLQAQLKKFINDEENGSGNENKKRKLGEIACTDEMNIAMVADSFDKDLKIQELTEKVQLLETELRKKTEVQTGSSRKTDVANKSTEIKTTRTLPSSPPLPNISTLFHDLQAEMTSQMCEMKLSLEASIEEKIGKAIGTTNNKTSYAAATSQGSESNDLRTIMLEAKNAEIVNDNERNKRANNIIIHGVTEQLDYNEEDKKKFDENYVATLLSILGVTVTPKSFTRLGKNSDNGKSRPLKLAMNSTDDKQLIMSRLPNLKTADDQYRKISVKDDFTPDERSQIRLWHEKATNLNTQENTTQYKVRGSPKNGLYLVKIKAPQVKPVDSSLQVVA